MAYTYGAGIQSSPNAAYNLWGSTGPTNPYIMQGGPSYTPNPIPPQAMPPQGGSLMPSVSGGSMGGAGGDSNMSSYYFNQAKGDRALAAKLAARAGDTHAAYLLDHSIYREENNIPAYNLWDTNYPGNVGLGIPSDDQTLDSAKGLFSRGTLGIISDILGYDNPKNSVTQSWEDMQNTPVAGVMQNITPMINYTTRFDSGVEREGM
jgi:hypothetical protein